MTRTHKIILSAVAAASLLGCAAKNQQVVSTHDPAADKKVAQAPAPQPQVEVRSDDDDASATFAPIRYELDSARLTPESQETLRRLAEYLRARPKLAVQISGHTCELGTAEYNIALGQQRAESARKYLVALGVDPSRVETLSYGEERPVSESALDQNRRSEFAVRVVGTHAAR